MRNDSIADKIIHKLMIHESSICCNEKAKIIKSFKVGVG